MDGQNQLLDYENNDDAKKIDAWLTQLPKYNRPRQAKESEENVARLNNKRPRPRHSSPEYVQTANESEDEVECLGTSKPASLPNINSQLAEYQSHHRNVCGGAERHYINNNSTLASNNNNNSSSSSQLPPGIRGTLADKRKHNEAEKGVVWSSGGWEWVADPRYKRRTASRNDSDEDVQRFKAEYAKIKSEGGLREHPKALARQTHAAIIELAKKHNVLHGKWLLYIKPKHFDEDWTKIKNTVLNGLLGPTAKVSETPGGNQKTHVVCVYCPDFTDKDELLRVRRAIMNEIQLKSLSTPHSMKAVYFKTDAFTYLGKYSDRESLIEVSGATKDDVKAALGVDSLSSLVFGEDDDVNSSLRTTSYDCGGEKDLSCTTLLLGSADCTNSKSCQKCYPRCLGLREDRILSVVGVQHVEARGRPRETVILVREPDNENDSNAIKVMNSTDGKLGYINQTQAKKLAPKLDLYNSELSGTILEEGFYPGSAMLMKVARFF